MTRRITVRPVTPADHDALLQVYATTRADLAALPPDVAGPLIGLQYQAQDQTWRAAHPGATFQAVLADGDDVVGRLHVDRSISPWVLIDVIVAPQHQSTGIGTTLLANLLTEADAAGQTIHLHADNNSRAAAWYARLGFTPCEPPDDVRTKLERLPQL